MRTSPAESTSPPGPDTELAGALRAAGLRVTSQRIVLHRALRELDRHVSAEELQRAVGDRLPGLALPTIYATLELFERLGVVRRIAGASGAALFDPRAHPHEHFVCESCGAVTDLDVDAGVDARRALAAARRAGLQVAAVDVLLRGRCAGCR